MSSDLLRRAAYRVQDPSNDDASWLHLVLPYVGPQLSALLLAAADDFEMVEAINERAARGNGLGTYVLHSAWVGHAVAVARAVLGEQS